MSLKCKGSDKKGNCPLRDDCYRFTRKPDQNQQYYSKLPYEDNGGRCDSYLPHWVITELKQQKNGITDNNNDGEERGEIDKQ